MMLDKIAEQMEYRIVEGPNQAAVLRGRVLLLVDRLITGQTFEEAVSCEENGIVRDIHSFFYADLKADLLGVKRATKNILKYIPVNNQGQETDILALVKAIDNLIEKIG